MTYLHRILLVMCLAIMISGCATTSPETRLKQVATTVELAAYTGTTIHLRSHPTDTPKFALARDTLSLLLKDGKFDPESFRSALSMLPIKELRGENGALVITAAQILFESYAGELTDLNRAPSMRAIILAARDGLDRALVPPK